jgi:GMP synthase (glutamine-hydrolysing)
MAGKAFQAVVLSHVPFEDLGSLQPVLLERGFDFETVDVTTARFPLNAAERCDLLLVMGGPIGVYETAAYPFLADEIAIIRSRLSARKPTLGICLGGQLMAAAAGARVYPGTSGAEIGWKPITYSGAGKIPEWFSPLLAPDLAVFHWHGDTFDLPAGAQPLAATDLYANQAFTIELNALALQFHPEVTAEGLERWYVGHASELSRRRIPVPELRAAARLHAPRLVKAAQMFWNRWLDYIL